MSTDVAVLITGSRLAVVMQDASKVFHLLLLLPRQVGRELNDSGTGQWAAPEHARVAGQSAHLGPLAERIRSFSAETVRAISRHFSGSCLYSSTVLLWYLGLIGMTMRGWRASVRWLRGATPNTVPFASVVPTL